MPDVLLCPAPSPAKMLSNPGVLKMRLPPMLYCVDVLMLPAFTRMMLAPPVVMLTPGALLPDTGAGTETDEVWLMLTKIVSAGLTSSEAITLFYTQIKLMNGLPFPLRIPNKETRRAIREARARKNVETFRSGSEWAKNARSV